MGVRFYLASAAAVLLAAVVGVWIGALVAAVRADIRRQDPVSPVVVQITTVTSTPTLTTPPPTPLPNGAAGSPEPRVGPGG
ncbi:hypothetical protein [Streptoalloteichus hindustanus]|uniref:Uncharacterized protein n=1 Tax=Streptoalloteichus hindustanus TaxID=2017 RepID=A0A1M5PZX2_STRHI|nr:hypothetical protein [Streptoalloteichus hindustanus]SHH07222.1 hypothetical protein SAMN05444320_1216 [Streptoalloteichus hindustanus]